MNIRILGPLEVERDGSPVMLGPKQQTLLAILLVNRGSAVSVDRIVDDLYAGAPPRNAAKTLQVHVSRLRKALGDGSLQTTGGGYRLSLESGDLDLQRFDDLADAGRLELAEGNPQAASRHLGDALALWRGSPLADFAYDDFAQAEIARLQERRLTVVEDRIDADLASGRDAPLVGELEALVREHPLRESLRRQLMLALYRSGRQAEALDEFQRARSALVDELGIEPGRELRELERAILQQDPALDVVAERDTRSTVLDAVTSSPDSSATRQESRKTVTALSAAISASPTADRPLDPEALQRVTGRVLSEVSDAVTAHGGTVESVSAEGVSAVFGVPEVHEDDAMRAIRSANEIHRRLSGETQERLDHRVGGLDVRIGISTGEVVAGGVSIPGLLATGAPFLKSMRLANLAEPGKTILDESTIRLVDRLVEGEWATVGAKSVFRLARLVESPSTEPRFTAPMVGREREMRRLMDAYEQAVTDRSCQLFTILGAAGVGKSRLVSECLERLDGNTRVARGRCLPYGEGITFWPILEVVKELVDVDVADPESTRSRIAELLPEGDGVELIAEHIVEMIGLTEASVSAEERVAAMRRLVEGLGRRTPFVLVFDDIHWGEETFLELVDYLADSCRDTSVLLLCMARPELLDVRPGWAGGKLNATSVLLEPLSDDDCGELVGHLLGGGALSDDVGVRITRAAGGNPLFVEEMVAMLVDDGLLERHESRWVATADLTTVPVPPTISALLAARLDRLDPAERAAIERAAVEGKVFHRSSIESLSAAASVAAVEQALAALSRKELIRPERPVFQGEEAYSFRHLLIRDAAYASIPKQLRAELHEQHASWLQERIGTRVVEYDEIVGYHLEQSYRHRAELGPVDADGRAVGRRAAELLGAAGRRAFLRSDAPAGVNLFARAVAMLRPEDPLRVDLVPNVRVIQGVADLSWAERVLTEAIETSATTGDRGLAANALVQRGLLRLFSDESVTPSELLDVSERAIGVFESMGDELGLARAWRLAAQAHYLNRQAGRCVEASEHALAHARRAGDPFEEREIIEWLVIALILGPTPAPIASARCRQLLSETQESSLLHAEVLTAVATLAAMEHHGAEADALFENARAIIASAGEWVWIATVWHSFIHVWRGEHTGEAELRPAYDSLKAIGEKSHFSSIAHALANVVYAEGRYDEAEQLTRDCEAACRENDVHSQVLWRSIRARVFAQRHEFDEAERLAREAIEFAATSDFLPAHAEASEDLAEVLELAGRTVDSAKALEAALALYEEKGNLLAADGARTHLAKLSR